MTRSEIKEQLYDVLAFSETAPGTYDRGAIKVVVSDSLDRFVIINGSFLVISGELSDIETISLECGVFTVEFKSHAFYSATIEE